jgi:hypothetical protein
VYEYLDGSFIDRYVLTRMQGRVPATTTPTWCQTTRPKKPSS